MKMARTKKKAVGNNVPVKENKSLDQAIMTLIEET
jgi:hypothetical protein